MKKTSFIPLAILLVLVGFSVVQKADAASDNSQKNEVSIEGAMPDNSVIHIGKAFDKKSGKFVDGYAIVHFAKGSGNFAKPAPVPAVCYGYMAQGAKWKTLESWTIDNVNTGGIDSQTESGILDKSIGKWETAAGTGSDILGQGSAGPVSATVGKILDYKNEVTFAPIKNKGAIAVTTVWGNFGDSNIGNREIVEWDQTYNTKFAWSVSGQAGKMDFENIATHELGHAFGMADLYTSNCINETMYGYADYGQTNKRDLNAGDIAGIDLLYQ
jgi:hypothetical protein